MVEKIGVLQLKFNDLYCLDFVEKWKSMASHVLLQNDYEWFSRLKLKIIIEIGSETAKKIEEFTSLKHVNNF